MRRDTHMYCSHCGKQIADDDAFCRSCGTSQKRAATESAPPQQVSAPATQSGMPVRVTIQNPYAGKVLQLLGFVLFVVGLFWSCSKGHSGGGFLMPDIGGGFSDALPWIVALLGLALWIIGRFKHWYHAE